MKIYIQGEKVLQKYLKRAIYLPRKITKEFYGAIRKKAEDDYNKKKDEIANSKFYLRLLKRNILFYFIF